MLHVCRWCRRVPNSNKALDAFLTAKKLGFRRAERTGAALGFTFTNCSRPARTVQQRISPYRTGISWELTSTSGSTNYKRNLQATTKAASSWNRMQFVSVQLLLWNGLKRGDSVYLNGDLMMMMMMMMIIIIIIIIIGKVVPLFLTEHHAMKAYWESHAFLTSTMDGYE
jgi:hypothetical protein